MASSGASRPSRPSSSEREGPMPAPAPSRFVLSPGYTGPHYRRARYSGLASRRPIAWMQHHHRDLPLRALLVTRVHRCDLDQALPQLSSLFRAGDLSHGAPVGAMHGDADLRVAAHVVEPPRITRLAPIRGRHDVVRPIAQVDQMHPAWLARLAPRAGQCEEAGGCPGRPGTPGLPSACSERRKSRSIASSVVPWRVPSAPFSSAGRAGTNVNAQRL